MDVKEVAWWSVYEIGQRLTDKFDDVPENETANRHPRVFIAGDACHTHSPKAGQGMNVSMRDSFNLGWKLASVLQGQCVPELLHTYSQERQFVAKMLIDFDREWSAIISARPKISEDVVTQGYDPAQFQEYFEKSLRYTAGTSIQYHSSVICGEPTYQHLARGFEIGMRFHSAPVIRLADAKPVHLGHVALADGRWRLYAFAGSGGTGASGELFGLCDFLANDPASPVRKYTPPGQDNDSQFDLRAIFQQSHRETEIRDLHPLLLPKKGRYGLQDYEKAFCPDLKNEQDIFDMRGIDRRTGCLVVVRPDQHIAHVLPLDGHEKLARFFDAFMMVQG